MLHPEPSESHGIPTPAPVHVTPFACGHVFGAAQPFPLQSTSHAHASPQSTGAHAEAPLHVTAHRPVPHEIDVLHASFALQVMLQRFAAVQSIVGHARATLHPISQVQPVGHTTPVAHAVASLHAIVHVLAATSQEVHVDGQVGPASLGALSLMQ